MINTELFSAKLNLAKTAVVYIVDSANKMFKYPLNILKQTLLSIYLLCII